MKQAFSIQGMIYNDPSREFYPAVLNVQITNDSVGKTLSIDNGIMMFSVPFEPIETAMQNGGEKNSYS